MIFILKKIRYNRSRRCFILEKDEQFASSIEELDEETLFMVSQTFKALSDPTRIRILHLLFSGERSVNDIAEKLDISFQAASEQAKLFLGLGILEELTGQKRSRRFAFVPYLKIIEE